MQTFVWLFATYLLYCPVRADQDSDFWNVAVDENILRNADFNDPSIHGYVTRRRFVLDEIKVTSLDNKFILNLHHIYRKNSSSTNGPPVLLIPCLFGTSQIYVSDETNNSIGYMLADAGFDVWLANYRGTNEANELVSGGSIDNDRFNYGKWNFHFHEFAMHDVVAHIDYVLNKTLQEKLYIVTYSQGAPIMFHLLSAKPEYNNKIIKIASMAPFLSLKHLKSRVMKKMLNVVYRPSSFYSLWMPQGFLGAGNFIHNRVSNLCDVADRIYDFLKPFLWLDLLGLRDHTPCSKMMNFVLQTGKWLDKKRLPVYSKFFPAGTSRTNFEYYYTLQEMDTTQTVTAFDFTRQQPFFSFGNWNIEHYGQATPPVVNLSKVTAPIKLYYSEGDNLTPPEESHDLQQMLINTKVSSYYVNETEFGHVQFVWCDKHHKIDVYNDIIQYFHD